MFLPIKEDMIPGLETTAGELKWMSRLLSLCVGKCWGTWWEKTSWGKSEWERLTREEERFRRVNLSCCNECLPSVSAPRLKKILQRNQNCRTCKHTNTRSHLLQLLCGQPPLTFSIKDHFALHMRKSMYPHTAAQRGTHNSIKTWNFTHNITHSFETYWNRLPARLSECESNHLQFVCEPECCLEPKKFRKRGLMNCGWVSC